MLKNKQIAKHLFKNLIALVLNLFLKKNQPPAKGGKSAISSLS